MLAVVRRLLRPGVGLRTIAVRSINLAVAGEALRRAAIRLRANGGWSAIIGILPRAALLRHGRVGLVAVAGISAVGSTRVALAGTRDGVVGAAVVSALVAVFVSLCGTSYRELATAAIESLLPVEAGLVAVAVPAALTVAAAESTTAVAVTGELSAPEGTRAAVGESPVAHASTVRVPNVVVEQDGVPQPVETPSQQIERGKIGADSETQPELHGVADDGADGIEGLVIGVGRDRLAIEQPRDYR